MLQREHRCAKRSRLDGSRLPVRSEQNLALEEQSWPVTHGAYCPGRRRQQQLTLTVKELTVYPPQEPLDELAMECSSTE